MMQTVDISQPKPIQYASPPTPPASDTRSPSKSIAVLNATETDEMTISTHHHILIVTGPAGCGKSTVAKHLSDRYGFDYIEGDEVSHISSTYAMPTDVFTVPPKSKY
jgi:gluconokinase